MSEIAVVFNLDGRPADRSLLERMIAAAILSQPDSVGRYIDGPVGLGHALLRTTPESLRETQPLVDEAAGLCLVFDGRVDNRDELREAVAKSGNAVRTDIDAELVLRAYQSWREESPLRILGDFAYAIWDARQSRLFCARDPSGIRPFFYYSDGRTFVAGSELRQIFEDPQVAKNPDEGFIAEFLCGHLIGREDTLYRGISRLTPGCYLAIDSSGVKKRVYYDLGGGRQIFCQTDEEYAHRFLDIFEEAVRCRMRNLTGVAAELSGGLDSSSIVAIAEDLMQRGELSLSSFNTYTIVHDDPAADEHQYADDVGARWNRPVTHLRPYELDLTESINSSRRTMDYPDYPTAAIYRNLREAIAKDGIRIDLTGVGGDQFLTGTQYYYADLLRGFRWLKLIDKLRNDWRFAIPGTPNYDPLKIFFWWTLRPALPERLRRTIGSLVPRERFPASISGEFAKKVGLLDRLRAKLRGKGHANLCQQAIYDEFIDGWMVHCQEMAARDCGQLGIEPRAPFYDLRLVEFCYGLPDEQRQADNNLTKVIMRNAVGPLLPDSVLRRMTKGNLGPTFVRLFNRMGGPAFFDDLEIARLGWVDALAIRDMARERLVADPNKNMWPLLTAFTVEVWYNVHFVDGGERLKSRIEGRTSARSTL